MKGLHLDGDPVRLYFTNYERRPDEEEFAEIVDILNKHAIEELIHLAERRLQLYN